MTEFSVHLTREAMDDIKQIRDYYAMEFSVKSAVKVVDAINSRLRQLSDYPFSGSKVPDKWFIARGYRMAISGNYLIMYRLVKNEVIIEGVINARKDYSKLFLERDR